jgi:gamma-tubulin complex component 5
LNRVIDSTTNATTGFCARLLRSSKEKSFYLNEKISRVIEADPIIKLLLQHSLDAGFTLNILANLDRINELKNKSSGE